MGISIVRWLAASMWDFLPFCLLHTTSTIILYSTCSVLSMAYAHVLREGWKSWSTLKSTNQLLGCTGWAWGVPCVKKREHKRLYDFVGITFFSIDILKDMIVCWDARVLNSFMSNDRLFLWITRVLIFMTWLDYMIKIMLGSIPHQKLCFLSFTYSRTSRN